MIAPFTQWLTPSGAWNQSVQIAVSVLVVSMVGAYAGRRRPHLMMSLWCVVLVKCLMPPVWSSPVGIYSRWHVHRLAEVSRTLPSLPDDFRERADVAKPRLDRLAERSLDNGSSLGSPQAAVSPPSSWTWIWLAGLIGFYSWGALRFGLAWRWLRRACRPASPRLQGILDSLAIQAGLSRHPELLLTERSVGPAIIGLFRPVIVLPTALAEAPAGRIEVILAHELTHYRRRDVWLSALQFLTQGMWWFHPGVWWMQRQIHRTCERCCDQQAIARFGLRRKDYAAGLLDVLELRLRYRKAPACVGLDEKQETQERLTEIMNTQQPIPSTPWRYWGMAFILATLLLPGATWVHGSDLQTTADTLKQADQAFDAQQWEQAIPRYRQLVEANQQDGRSWFRLGYALHMSGKITEALEAHRRASQFPQARPVALYNMACALALQGKSEQAIEALENAIDAGFVSQRPISEDTDFASIAGDDRFQALAQRAQPAKKRQVYRQFDFWVGDWEVVTPAGKPVGKNRISKDENGFLITEKWTNAQGGTGTSINYYDRQADAWRQTWIDAQGNVIKYEGRFEDGAMRMQGQMQMADGRVGTTKMVLQPQSDGRVRQTIHQSFDQGKSWSVYFDGFYVPSASGSSKSAD